MYLTIKNTTLILQQLRLLMTSLEIVQHPLAAYIVPSGDAHHSLRMADCDQRRAFLTGFDGSSGIAVVTSNAALLWTDARYFIQAEAQLDQNWTPMKEGINITMEAWLNTNLPSGSYIGLDPKYVGNLEWDSLQASLSLNRNTLTSSNHTNLIDLVWGVARPECPLDPVHELLLEFAGVSMNDKIQAVYNEMVKLNNNVQVLVVTELDEIAWLLNLRGSDLPLAPVFNAFAILSRSSNELEIFIDDAKISDEIKNHLKDGFVDGNISFYSYDAIYGRVEYYVNLNLGKIWISKYANAYLGDLIPTPDLRLALTPISLLKAIKNEVEVQGMKRAHLKDSASIIVFLGWLENYMNSNATDLTEIDAVNKLTSIKQAQDAYISQSFKTISASGPNAAIIHYFPTLETNRNLSTNEMYLLDSGSHYLDGTRDITRTLYFAPSPTQPQMEHYTRVLKGHIAIATSTFPALTKGHHLDSFARQALWEVGLDYGHGTGHGIGSYLHVGEGPQSMAAKYNEDDPGLRANMFMSNEPGYYKQDAYGIRLENIVRVIESDNYQNFLQFETISWVPFERKLIQLSLLSQNEINWINQYHSTCRSLIETYLHTNDYEDVDYNQNGLVWLYKHTEPL